MGDEWQIMKLAKTHEKEAQQLVLEGLKEHFGFIDHSLNPDLYPILATYSKVGNLFLAGFLGEELVCTGGLLKETEDAARVTRMSTARNHRGKGFAKRMLRELERRAGEVGFGRVLLETNLTWTTAIGLYRNSGYKEQFRDETRVHMYKDLK